MNLKALDTIRRCRMLPEGSAVLAAVSGGADSMTLLHLLCSLREPLRLRVSAAHVNHGLRGAQADRDEAFVRAACARMGVPLEVLRADVAAQAARTGESVEECGRRIRYAFFAKQAERLNARVATAHTLSDSIETVLLNFARGTGLRGLCGIPPVRMQGGVCIIRPLIECTRREIEAYCAENAVAFVTDSTNFSRRYTRNRIRLDAMPVLYGVNPALDRAALRLLHTLREDEDYLESQAAQAFESVRRGEKLAIPDLLACHPAVAGRVLRLASRRATGVVQENRHIGAMLRLVRAGRGQTELKGGMYARAAHDLLSFCPAQPGEGIPRGLSYTPGDGTFALEAGPLTLRIATACAAELKNFKNIHKQYFKNAVDCDRIKGTIEIRARREGDRYRPAGRHVTKSLKKLLNEAKIPVEERNLLPVLADSSGILWVAGFGPDERCAVTGETRSFLQISWNLADKAAASNIWRENDC